jgi:hypothetical protein
VLAAHADLSEKLSAQTKGKRAGRAAAAHATTPDNAE